MQIQVELFGIPRARAGVERTTARGNSLGEVLADLAIRFPDLAETCIEASSGCQRLRPGYAANLRGEQFISNPETPIGKGDTLLLLNLDAGG